MSPLERARAGWAIALEGHPFVNVDDLIAEIERDEAQLWRGVRSDVFTRITDGVVEMGPVHGDLREMLHDMLPQIEIWAKAVGARELYVQAGREGWERPLTERGFEVAAVILRKKID